jgi:hypothetical protein
MPMSFLTTQTRPEIPLMGLRLGRLRIAMRRLRHIAVNPATPPKPLVMTTVPDYLRRDVGLPPVALGPAPTMCAVGATATRLQFTSTLLR